MSVAYSPDGRHITSGSKDCTIRIWDAKTGTAVGSPLKGHTEWVWCVAYAPDGRRIISGSSDRTIRIWDAVTGAAVGNPLMGHTSWVRSVAYSPDGRYITSGSVDRTIRIWDAENGTPVGTPLEGHADQVIISIASGSVDKDTRAKRDMGGWVMDLGGGLLYWVPLDYRQGLYSPAVLTIPLTSVIRSVSLDFDDFASGTSWTQIFKNTSS